MTVTFADIGIARPLSEALRLQGLAVPTPVQEEAIPALLKGEDLIAQAQTGTGKTLAFALPLLQRLERDNPHVQALVVAPTRELALQIRTELAKLAAVYGVSVLAAYGGQDVEAQIRKLQHAPAIVVGTPGRLLDHVRRGSVDFSQVRMLVLDEADQMLHMGFLAEVETLIRTTPVDRQTMLFSATIPESIRRLAARYMRTPRDIRIASEQVTVDKTKQLVIETTDRGKLEALVRLIATYRPYLAVVFCRTKLRAKKLNEALIGQGLDADELHGDLTQAKREQVLQRFRDAKLQILVATDVAARGIDVEGVTHVINYDIPHDAESYIHRIGRTGRAGQTGFAITLAAPRDRRYLELIEDGIGMGLPRRRDRELGGSETLDEVVAAVAPANARRAGGGGTGRRTSASSRADAPRRGAGRSPGPDRGRKEQRGIGRGAAAAGRGTRAGESPRMSAAARDERTQGRMPSKNREGDSLIPGPRQSARPADSAYTTGKRVHSERTESDTARPTRREGSASSTRAKRTGAAATSETKSRAKRTGQAVDHRGQASGNRGQAARGSSSRESGRTASASTAKTKGGSFKGKSALGRGTTEGRKGVTSSKPASHPKPSRNATGSTKRGSRGR